MRDSSWARIANHFRLVITRGERSQRDRQRETKTPWRSISIRDDSRVPALQTVTRSPAKASRHRAKLLESVNNAISTKSLVVPTRSTLYGGVLKLLENCPTISPLYFRLICCKIHEKRKKITRAKPNDSPFCGEPEKSRWSSGRIRRGKVSF